jgi:tetratricopeptide (TPR) repeat protein/2-polyprenyl-3-methyl-5-hydroxy-6-metoxy-1,4-benzoquinol methylase
LQLDPNQPAALHLLGVLAHQLGDHTVAENLITKAIALQPGYAEAHCNLGNTIGDLGRLDEAVACYRKAIAIQPDFAEAHGNLGNTLRMLGRCEEALTHCDTAIGLNPGLANAHSNRGNALKEMGRLEEALTSYQCAIDINPDYAEAHFNMAATLHKTGKREEAKLAYRKTLHLLPKFAEAHNNLGNVLKDMGRWDEALASYRKAIEVEAEFSNAHYNLGTALKATGRRDDAIACFRKAIDLNPNFAEAHSNLGATLQEMGNMEAAIVSQRRAIALNPDNDLFWAALALSVESVVFNAVNDDVWQALGELLARPTIRPLQIARAIVSALRHHPKVSPLLKADNTTAYGDAVKQLSAAPILLELMSMSIINDIDVERMLTRLRRAMTLRPLNAFDNDDDASLNFAASLALHCFTNEYIFLESDDEKRAVEKLSEKTAALLASGATVPPWLVAALGAYRPLYQYPWGPDLIDCSWSTTLNPVITRQIKKPQEEIAIAENIRSLTTIENAVSQAVRSQYEENPFPRWIRGSFRGQEQVGGHTNSETVQTIGAYLQMLPRSLDLTGYVSPQHPKILVAGCGTGQHALSVAARYSNATVLAVDLSLRSLSYAKRKSREYGFENIEFAHADILELGGLNQSFDLIECAGVLHHLEDPQSGWRVLVDLLSPGGLMKTALYSEIARRNIVRGRALVAEQGYSSTPKDIRACRQKIINSVEGGNPELAQLISFNDFFSMSECRDFLFHVQEHRFTIPKIEAAIRELKLKFLGFELSSQQTAAQFQTARPEKTAMTSLPLWHEFETKNPDTFIAMYQFWCQKFS